MSNLPPGVSESDIPGNRPEDVFYDKVYDMVGSLLADLDINEDAEDADGVPLGLHQPFVEAVDEVVISIIAIHNNYGLREAT